MCPVCVGRWWELPASIYPAMPRPVVLGGVTAPEVWDHVCMGSLPVPATWIGAVEELEGSTRENLPCPCNPVSTEWLRLEGSSGAHLVQLPHSSRATYSQLPWSMSRWPFNISKCHQNGMKELIYISLVLISDTLLITSGCVGESSHQQRTPNSCSMLVI